MAATTRRKPPRLSLRTLGDAIRTRRFELAMSQEDLGRRCKLDRTYISGVENGKRNPTVTCIDSIARALDLSFHELIVLAQPSSD